jgi:hypothetical protein
VTLNLTGDATYGPNNGSGGWQIVDRPKLTAATQWYDRAPYNLQIPVMLDHTSSSKTPISINVDPSLSVEPECARLENWMNKVAGQLMPPVLRISGPVPGTEKLWVMHTLEFKEALRDVNAGFRYQQTLNLEFYEYTPPLNNLFGNYGQGHAANWANNQQVNTGTQSYETYIVKDGDTLQKIATKMYGNANDMVKKIAALNNIRDFRNIPTGRVLIMPRPYYGG